MKNQTVTTIAILLILTISIQAEAQSTFAAITQILQAKCTGACHSGTTPSGSLDFNGTEAAVYASLVNVAPENAVAQSKGYKRVEPGYPFRSFLMKKVNHGLDPRNELADGEESAMHNTTDTLAKPEIELIRQWIIWGAQDTSIVHNSNLINDYYTNGGIPETTAPLTPEQEGREGYQVKFGPIFMKPHEEFEFFQVYKPNQAISKEITELRSVMPPQSHHWALRTISQEGVNAMGVTPMAGANYSTQMLVFQYTKFMAIWQFSDDLAFPSGTAHFQDSTKALLLNLHMFNYSDSLILPASAYLNVYTQPMGSGAVEMKTEAHSYGGINPFLLQIPNTGLPFTLQDELIVPGETRYLWNIQSHTHALGKDFDMFLRNPDGTKGNQIYEGFFNEDYTVNKGYYDYAHPPVRTFEPLMELNMDNGLIFEATWINNGPDTMGFGLTTKEEMFVTYYQYTSEVPTGLKEVVKDDVSLLISPNPGKDNFILNYTLKNQGHTSIELYNSLGAKVKSVFTGDQHAGKQHVQMDISNDKLPAGIYFITVSTDGSVTTKRIITMN